MGWEPTKPNLLSDYINMLIVKDLVKDSNNKGENTCNIHTEYANVLCKSTGWSAMSWRGFPTFFMLEKKRADDVSISGG